MTGRVAIIGIGFICSIVALIWPALYNRQPLFFPDTITYIRGADAGLQKLTGASSPWTKLEDEAPRVPTDHPSAIDVNQSVSSIKDKSILAGRSVYYGAFLYFGDKIGRLWPTVIVQALVLMLAMGLYFRAFGIPIWPQLLMMSVAMGIFTSAAFYVSFLMPDLFAAVTLLACASLLGGGALGRVDYFLWAGLLAFSLISHTSHVLMAAALLSVSVLVDIFTQSWTNWRGVAVIFGCLVLAAAAEAAFSMAVTHIVGAPPLRPPFLMAHSIEDGPGYRYLRDTCPASGFKVCDFLPVLPMKADRFIWFRDPPGVFAPAPVEVRRQLSSEQYRFVLAVFRYDPKGVIDASIDDVVRLLGLMGLDEFNAPGYRDVRTAKLPSEYRSRFQSSAAYRGTMPTRSASVIELVTFIASAIALLLMLISSRLRRQFERKQICMLALLVLGLVSNAAICGVLSGPNGDRYATRVAWLIPFAALIACFALIGRRRGRGRIAAGGNATT